MRKLTHKEEEIMKLFWENGGMFVKDMLETLPNPKPHINTVSTQVRILEKDGFSIHDGHPTFQNKYTDPVNAREFAAHLLKREYQNGYSLPAMPTDV